MAVVSMKNLLESGVHFGHTTRRWDPKMAEYIYTSRNGIHIIDLQKTAKMIEVAYKALKEIVDNGGKVLFVGTKKQAMEVVKSEAVRCEEFYVNQRWLGGTLTNFKTIRKRIRRLHDLYRMDKDGSFEVLPKKEVIQLGKERDRLEKFLYGIKDMRSVPQALFVVDPRKEKNAIAEARILKIPVFGIVDTTCDPGLVDFIIPANDDAITAVKLLVAVMANAVAESKGLPLATFESVPREPRPERRGQSNYNNRNKDFKRDNSRPYKGRNDSRPPSRPYTPRPTTPRPAVAVKPAEGKPVVAANTEVVTAKPVVVAAKPVVAAVKTEVVTAKPVVVAAKTAVKTEVKPVAKPGAKPEVKTETKAPVKKTETEEKPAKA